MLESTKPFKVVICILAHNEEKNIKETIQTLVNSSSHLKIPIHIYANGCTDKTIEISNKLADKNPLISINTITTPSKINAWNCGFQELDAEYIIFCDGDILPQKNTIENLILDLDKNQNLIISSTRPIPKLLNLSWSKKCVGFLQLPLSHQYLTGQMYIVRKKLLQNRLQQYGLSALPRGVVGEDAFIEHLLENHELFISKSFIFYEPADFHDYFRYLARLRWQNEQINIFYKSENKNNNFITKIFTKIMSVKNPIYLIISIPASLSRILFKWIFRKKIESIYKQLGTVTIDGEQILSGKTRSNSSK